MKIVLFALNGSYSHSNLAIRRLRVPLEEGGYEVETAEANLRDADSRILERLYGLEGDLYGFSCYIWNIDRMVLLAKNLKLLLPDAKILFGGPEVSYDEERFGEEVADYIIKGPGEDALRRLCDSLAAGEPFPRITDGGREVLSRGILYRTDETLPKTLYYESAVGCPFSCSYCLSSAGTGVSCKPAEQVLTELAEFEKLPGDFIIKFIDRTFNADLQRAEAILRGIYEGDYKKRYQFEICASLMSEGFLQALSLFPRGQIQLEAGLQSTNEKTLAAVARHMDASKTLENCRRIMALGTAHLHLDLIAGLPFEDYGSFRRSFNDAYPCCDLLQLGFLKLLHGTALRRDAEQYGIVYGQNPPYEVLKTDWISYPELRRLHEISDLTERYRDSGHFAETLRLGVPLAATPFDFYEGLAGYIRREDSRPIRAIGQTDAYGLLYGYLMSLGAVEETLSDALHADFTASEVRHVPKFGGKRKS